jgi:ubiquinone/menaquinone biosynthesis C-methylase UbiE
MSWDEAFARRYDEWAAEMTEDVPFYVELAREADGPLVELAIGNGRVAIPVAQATGRSVIGIDSSPAMLEQARARAAKAGVELDVREGDMRELTLDEQAALIYCPFRALLHLPTWADRRRTFDRVAASLQPGGRFAWNAFAFDHQIAARLEGQHQDEPLPHTIRYAVGDNRIDITLDDGATSSLWWATKNEWLGLVDVAGLEIEALYGGFDRQPLDDDSREYVFIARRL